jgi:hypothetical protein
MAQAMEPLFDPERRIGEALAAARMIGEEGPA